MLRSILNGGCLSTAPLARPRRGLAAALALSLIAAPLAAQAGPAAVSPAVEEHLVAQAGLSIGFALDQVAQFFSVFDGISGGSGCQAGLGTSSTLTGDQNGSTDSAVLGVYYDNACGKPYFTDNIEMPSQSGSVPLVHGGQFAAPNGALLGALSLVQQLSGTTSSLDFSGKGTYKAIAGLGQPPVRFGHACNITSNLANQETITCQAGVAQDFPALKMALGTIVNLTMSVQIPQPNLLEATFTGANAKLATGKLGSLSIVVVSPSAVGFQGQHAVVGTGSLAGATPNFSIVPPATTEWTFTDSQHATKFSISTTGNLSSSGKVIDTKTHAALSTIAVDQSGTGAITYSDKTKAKITNWTLSD